MIDTAESFRLSKFVLLVPITRTLQALAQHWLHLLESSGVWGAMESAELQRGNCWRPTQPSVCVGLVGSEMSFSKVEASFGIFSDTVLFLGFRARKFMYEK